MNIGVKILFVIAFVAANALFAEKGFRFMKRNVQHMNKMPQKRVLLMGYEEDGLKLLYQMLKEYPLTFGIHEPFQKFKELSSENIKDEPSNSTLTPTKAFKILSDIYNCNFNELNYILKSPSKYDLEMVKKVLSNWPEQQKNSEMVAKICEMTQITLIDSTKIDMEVVEMLVNKYNGDLKVIHLLRDPRKILDSTSHKEFKLNVAKTCDRMSKNIHKYNDLASKYPNSFMDIRYEDLAAHGPNFSKKIFEFLEGFQVKLKYISISTKKAFKNVKKDLLELDMKINKPRLTRMMQLRQENIKRKCFPVIDKYYS